MSRENSRRSARRVPVSFITEYEGRSSRGKGSGRVENISASGALIEDADTLLLSGAVVTLTFSFFPDSLPVEASARVVRETPTGFGVEFLAMKPRVRAVLRMAIAKLASEEADLDDDDDVKTLMRIKRPAR
jgi:hypothetical protein